MALAAEAFGNKMCFLEDITLEVSRFILIINKRVFTYLFAKRMSLQTFQPVFSF